ncbi:hypothetical protein GCM10010245_69400 [Streptomyces spectabilis]|nr:hypothetical protein GCM10010245_69400 [Streptomyces spectabilis]
MTAAPERASPAADWLSRPCSPGGAHKHEIESEIVIVDDDGTEEPFDPSSWFAGSR